MASGCLPRSIRRGARIRSLLPIGMGRCAHLVLTRAPVLLCFPQGTSAPALSSSAATFSSLLGRSTSRSISMRSFPARHPWDSSDRSLLCGITTSRRQAMPAFSCAKHTRRHGSSSFSSSPPSSSLGSTSTSSNIFLGTDEGSNHSHNPQHPHNNNSKSRRITTRPIIEATRAGPSFKVSRVSYDGTMETVTLGTTELLKTASIFARDLFFTLNLTSRQERKQKRGDNNTIRRSISAIQPRQDVIVLSFGKVRAVVKHNDVLIFDAHSPAVRQFAQELRHVYQSGNLHGEPNELVFLECVLRDTVDSFHRRLRLFEPIVDAFLEKVDNNDVTSADAGVHQLVPLKDALQSFEIQVKQSLECLQELLNDDSEMLALLLTEQKAADEAGGVVEFKRHEHVEVLLGVYARQISNINMEINYVLQRLQSKQEFVALALSGYRNRMIRMNVHLAIAGLGIGLSTAVAGFFGMNLISGLEASPTAFPTAIFCSCIGSAIISLSCLNLLSGRTMRKQAVLRLNEMETLTAALSDIAVVDHILQSTVERGQSLDKARFSTLLRRANGEREISSREVDILFDVFDRVKDGNLNQYDFDESSFAAGDGTSSRTSSSNAMTTDDWLTTTGK